MAITRRQFVVTLGSMAAALGFSQADLAKVTEVFADGTYSKPKIIWVHGAECTGCSTSAIGLFEDAAQMVSVDTNDALHSTSVLSALGLVTGGAVPRSFNDNFLNVDCLGNGGDGKTGTAATAVSIQDVLVDILDVQYHETVMGPGGDLAYQLLADNIYNGSTDAFVLVVEGAVQVFSDGGAWGQTGVEGTDAPWCSIGMDADTHAAGFSDPYGNNGELSFDAVVSGLASQDTCLAVIAIGQCATYGGYPGCVSPASEFAGSSQTPAFGVHEFLADHAGLDPDVAAAAAGKVVNVPGCPVNPWWFVLTVVLFLVDLEHVLRSGNAEAGPLGILDRNAHIVGGVDYGRRLTRVYPQTVHNGLCPRYDDFKGGKFASKPGEAGCLMNIGCKGISTKAMCSIHGWNGGDTGNPDTWDHSIGSATGNSGSFCVTAGHPCMGCTEKGYPDKFVPFVKMV